MNKEQLQKKLIYRRPVFPLRKISLPYIYGHNLMNLFYVLIICSFEKNKKDKKEVEAPSLLENVSMYGY